MYSMYGDSHEDDVMKKRTVQTYDDGFSLN